MEKHTKKEDIIAILTGTFVFAQGILFLQAGGLVTGGTAGLALLLTHLTSLSFGTLYFWVNLPFYILAWKRFGASFAINTAIACAIVSVFSNHLNEFISLSSLNMIYCSVAGGILMGLGMLILFRHRCSLGGFNVFCLYIQDKLGISVGKTQIFIDSAIVIASFVYLPYETVLCSIVSVVFLNLVLGMNHKPTRYIVSY
ncbi:YitT family protein [Vibrio sp.]|uniref:YitT family protein n=1 Tax=Vibrio viridaestus TaxID=2487322 RepID=A0A3N9TE01_9VIBR|nr:YitT family protein [Vibrio viridaestus]MDC0611569.1 YitT family protein [Vibrio sp.]RQW62448.1 YitT family protein [Vibrio viridaestus]